MPGVACKTMSDGDEAESAPVTTTIEDGVAVLRFDDGKVNVLSYAAIDALSEGLDRAEREASAVCIVGRPGRMSAGFDLAVMTTGIESALDMLTKGGEMMLRLFLHPQPVVVGVTGHALAGGALLVLCCDIRIGADAPTAKVGLNETSIGMPLPRLFAELARARLSPRALSRATLAAELYDPRGAVEAGYLDQVVPAEECEAAAIAEARRLGAYATEPYAQTKRILRQPIVDRIREGDALDMGTLDTNVG